MSPKYFSDQAIVLKRHNYAEADRILTLFTRRHGKIGCLAKGIRKTTSRKAPHLEPLSLAKVYLVTTHSSLSLIVQAETLNSFTGLKNNLKSLRLAFHLLEIVDKLLAENQPQPDVFADLLIALEDLNETAANQFNLKLLSTLGFGQPPLQDTQAVTDYIESILDRRLTARSHLS